MAKSVNELDIKHGLEAKIKVLESKLKSVGNRWKPGVQKEIDKVKNKLSAIQKSTVTHSSDYGPTTKHVEGSSKGIQRSTVTHSSDQGPPKITKKGPIHVEGSAKSIKKHRIEGHKAQPLPKSFRTAGGDWMKGEPTPPKPVAAAGPRALRAEKKQLAEAKAALKDLFKTEELVTKAKLNTVIKKLPKEAKKEIRRNIAAEEMGGFGHKDAATKSKLKKKVNKLFADLTVTEPTFDELPD